MQKPKIKTPTKSLKTQYYPRQIHPKTPGAHHQIPEVSVLYQPCSKPKKLSSHKFIHSNQQAPTPGKPNNTHPKFQNVTEIQKPKNQTNTKKPENPKIPRGPKRASKPRVEVQTQRINRSHYAQSPTQQANPQLEHRTTNPK